MHIRVVLLMATRKTYIDNAGNLVGPRKNEYLQNENLDEEAESLADDVERKSCRVMCFVFS